MTATATTPTPVAPAPLDLSDPRVAEAITREVARVLAAAGAVLPVAVLAPLPEAPAGATSAPAPPAATPAPREYEQGPEDDWDRPVVRRRAAAAPPPAVEHPGAGQVPTVAQAVDAWITAKRYSPSTAKGARQHLLSKRAIGWRRKHSIDTIEDLTAAQASAYLSYLEERGAEPASLAKVKTLLSSLAKFCARTPGYQMGLRGDELRSHSLPPIVEKNIPALDEDECLRLIAACDTIRDRMIIETLLMTGVRVSELCALTVDVVHLDRRPAYIAVVGSVHNPKRPKTPKEREIPVDYDKDGFGKGFVKRLQQYIEENRDRTWRRELFLTHRNNAKTGEKTGLTRDGVEMLMSRLEAKTGIHCNPHKLRHTFATRCVDRGVNMFDLADMLGHQSLDMVRRYYARNLKRRAANLARAFEQPGMVAA